MKSELRSRLRGVKEASQSLMRLDDPDRNRVLCDLAHSLRQNSQAIMIENHKDLLCLSQNDPKYDRLRLSEERIALIAADVEAVAALSHHGRTILSEKQLSNGLKIRKVSVPLGVVAIIYESRPNVTIDAFVLCFKTGNACVLKGGKEASHTNRFLVALVQKVLQVHHLSPDLIYLLPLARAATHTLLAAHQLVDVCIPRGSQALINFVREHAKIPFIETGAGIVHTYFDLSADLEKSRLIINNAKTRRVSVCNALDTLIIHEQRLSDLPEMVALLLHTHVEIFADAPSHQILQGRYPEHLLHQASAENFGEEFLSYKISVKTVASVQDAVAHIQHHSSGHSEAILAEDQRTIDYFLEAVDAAVVYVNTSTAFTDGGQFGMGAEIGISTQKLHVRGPMSLDALMTYKWVVLGDGQIRS